MLIVSKLISLNSNVLHSSYLFKDFVILLISFLSFSVLKILIMLLFKLSVHLSNNISLNDLGLNLD